MENQEAMKIKYVFHTGDLVDESDKEEQWNNADQFMKTLDDANVPNGVLAGNHDVDHKTNDYTQYLPLLWTRIAIKTILITGNRIKITADIMI